MFDSVISVKDLVEELRNEVDVALDIPATTYVQWLNSLQQVLYTEVIKEQKKTVLKTSSNDKISISSISVGNDENRPRFEDIYAIYADNVQLIKSTPASGVIFPNTFYKDNNDIGYHTANVPDEFTIVYIVKPSLYDVVENDDGDYNIVAGNTNVMVPIEFIDLVKAKLRGEAYKLANEAELSAMWLNDYNILLETFKAWIADKSPNFGL